MPINVGDVLFNVSTNLSQVESDLARIKQEFVTAGGAAASAFKTASLPVETLGKSLNETTQSADSLSSAFLKGEASLESYNTAVKAAAVQTKELGDAFKTLGVKSTGEFQKEAAEAKKAFAIISQSGQASANDVLRAQQAAVAKEIALYKSMGQVVPKELAGISATLSKQLHDAGVSGQQAFSGADNVAKGFGSTLGSLKQIAAGLGLTFGALGIAQAIRSGVAAAGDFQEAWTKVSVILRQSDPKIIESFKNQILALPPALGTASDNARAFYQIISSGFTEPAQALELLKNSAIAAAGGFTKTEIAAKTGAAVLQAYGLQVNQSKEVFDIMAKTVDLGVISFEELASELGNVIPIAAANNVSFTELSASIAALTLQGLPASQAISGLRSVISSILTPSSEAVKVSEKLNIRWDEHILKAKGLVGTLKQLENATRDQAGAVRVSSEDIAKLTGRIEATNAVMALTSENGAKKLGESIIGLGDATKGAGASADSLAAAQKTLAFQLKETKNEIINAAQAFGDSMAPAISGTLAGLRSLVSSLATTAKATSSFWSSATSGAGGAVDAILSVGQAFGVAPSYIQKASSAVKGFGDSVSSTTGSVFAWGEAIVSAVSPAPTLIRGLSESVQAFAGDMGAVTIAVASFGGVLAALKIESMIASVGGLSGAISALSAAMNASAASGGLLALAIQAIPFVALATALGYTAKLWIDVTEAQGEAAAATENANALLMRLANDTLVKFKNSGNENGVATIKALTQQFATGKLSAEEYQIAIGKLTNDLAKLDPGQYFKESTLKSISSMVESLGVKSVGSLEAAAKSASVVVENIQAKLKGFTGTTKENELAQRELGLAISEQNKRWNLYKEEMGKTTTSTEAAAKAAAKAAKQVELWGEAIGDHVKKLQLNVVNGEKYVAFLIKSGASATEVLDAEKKLVIEKGKLVDALSPAQAALRSWVTEMQKSTTETEKSKKVLEALHKPVALIRTDIEEMTNVSVDYVLKMQNEDKTLGELEDTYVSLGTRTLPQVTEMTIEMSDAQVKAKQSAELLAAAEDDLESAYKKAGITSSEQLHKQADDARLTYERIRDSGKASARDVQLAWAYAAEVQIESARKSGEQIPLATIAAVDKIKGKYGEMKNASDNAFNSAAEVARRQVSTIFTDFSKGFADILFSAGSFGKKIGDLFKEIGKGIVRSFLESGLLGLFSGKGLSGFTGFLSGLSTSITKIFGGIKGGNQGGFSLPSLAGAGTVGATPPFFATSSSNTGGGAVGMGGLSLASIGKFFGFGRGSSTQATGLGGQLPTTFNNTAIRTPGPSGVPRGATFGSAAGAGAAGFGTGFGLGQTLGVSTKGSAIAGGIGAAAGVISSLIPSIASAAGPIGMAVGAAAAAVAALVQKFTQRGRDKTAATAQAEALSATVWKDIIPAAERGEITIEQASDAIKQSFDAYQAWLKANLKDQTVIQRSIDGQRLTLTEGLAAVEKLRGKQEATIAAREKLATFLEELGRTGAISVEFAAYLEKSGKKVDDFKDALAAVELTKLQGGLAGLKQALTQLDAPLETAYDLFLRTGEITAEFQKQIEDAGGSIDSFKAFSTAARDLEAFQNGIGGVSDALKQMQPAMLSAAQTFLNSNTITQGLRDEVKGLGLDIGLFENYANINGLNNSFTSLRANFTGTAEDMAALRPIFQQVGGDLSALDAAAALPGLVQARGQFAALQQELQKLLPQTQSWLEQFLSTGAITQELSDKIAQLGGNLKTFQDFASSSQLQKTFDALKSGFNPDNSEDVQKLKDLINTINNLKPGAISANVQFTDKSEIDALMKSVGAAIQSVNQSAATNLSTEVGKLQGSIEDRIGELQKGLTAALDDVATRLGGTLEKARTDLIAAIDATGVGLTGVYNDTRTALIGVLGTLDTNLTATIASLQAALTKAIDDLANSIVAAAPAPAPTTTAPAPAAPAPNAPAPGYQNSNYQGNYPPYGPAGQYGQYGPGYGYQVAGAFQKGGKVPVSGLARVEEGELVLPQKASEDLTRLLDSIESSAQENRYTKSLAALQKTAAGAGSVAGSFSGSAGAAPPVVIVQTAGNNAAGAAAVLSLAGAIKSLGDKSKMSMNPLLRVVTPLPGSASSTFNPSQGYVGSPTAGPVQLNLPFNAPPRATAGPSIETVVSEAGSAVSQISSNAVRALQQSLGSAMSSIGADLSVVVKTFQNQMDRMAIGSVSPRTLDVVAKSREAVADSSLSQPGSGAASARRAVHLQQTINFQGQVDVFATRRMLEKTNDDLASRLNF